MNEGHDPGIKAHAMELARDKHTEKVGMSVRVIFYGAAVFSLFWCRHRFID